VVDGLWGEGCDPFAGVFGPSPRSSTCTDTTPNGEYTKWVNALISSKDTNNKLVSTGDNFYAPREELGITGLGVPDSPLYGLLTNPWRSDGINAPPFYASLQPGFNGFSPMLSLGWDKFPNIYNLKYGNISLKPGFTEQDFQPVFPSGGVYWQGGKATCLTAAEAADETHTTTQQQPSLPQQETQTRQVPLEQANQTVAQPLFVDGAFSSYISHCFRPEKPVSSSDLLSYYASQAQSTSTGISLDDSPKLPACIATRASGIMIGTSTMPGWEQPGLGMQLVRGSEPTVGKLYLAPYGGGLFNQPGFGPPEVWFSKENLAPLTGVMWSLIDSSVGVDFGTSGYAYMTGSTMLSDDGYALFLNEGYSKNFTGDPGYGLAMMFCTTGSSVSNSSPASCAWEALVAVEEGAPGVIAASIKSPPVANNGGVKSNDGVMYANFDGIHAKQLRHLVLVAHDTAAQIKDAIVENGGFACDQDFPFNTKVCPSR
jgi:hypothetical protein